MTAFTGLLERIERLQDRITRLQLRPQNDRRIARIERLEDKVDQAESLLPQDTFEISFKAPDETGRLYRFEVDVYDSPFDDTFTGGDPVLLNVRARGRRTQWGNGGRNMTTTLANGDYWAGEERQTLWIGSSNYDQFPEYETMTVTLAIDTRDWKNDNQIGDVLAVQTFDMASLFA